MNLRMLLVLAGLAVIVWGAQRWRRAVQLAMLMVIFEGALRKWVLLSAQDLVYFAKDVVLLGAYIGFFRERHRLHWKPPAAPLLWGSLVLGLFIGALQIFNPNLPNLLVGILGFKAYFFYVPLLFLMPAMYRNDAELARDLRLYILVAIPVNLLAVAQFFSPASSPLNSYARTATDAAYIATFGSSTFVRVTATFSFITGYTSYLLAMAILILAWLGCTRWQFRGNFLVFGAFAGTLLGMLMTGSRGPVVLLLVLLPFYWWLGVLRERGGGGTFGRLVLGLTLVTGLLAWAGQDALGAFYGRAMGGAHEVTSRVTTPLEAPFHVLPEAGLFGFGIGATHQMATAVTPGLPPYAWLRGLLIEVESGRIVLELGAIGFVVIYLIRLYLIVFSFRQVWRMRTRFHRGLAVASFLYLLGSLPVGNVFDVTASLYYWAFAGLLLTVMRLDQDAARAAAPVRSAPRVAAPTPLPRAG